MCTFLHAGCIWQPESLFKVDEMGPKKTNIFKVTCLECTSIMDNDYRTKLILRRNVETTQSSKMVNTQRSKKPSQNNASVSKKNYLKPMLKKNESVVKYCLNYCRTFAS